jgi:ATP-dependent DNA helicase RecG
MHRNYQTNAPAKFYEYSNRIELDNPGSLYGKVHPENFPNVNDYRNPVIAEAMKALGYVNRFNRGVNMVQEMLVENKNGQAIFDFSDISSFKATVMNADEPVSGAENGAEKPLEHIDNKMNIYNANKGGAENGADDGTENSAEKNLAREKEIIELIIKDNSITRKAIANKLGLGTTTVYRYIESLKRQGFIERVGGDKGGYWRIK